jgi:hypothetical protein
VISDAHYTGDIDIFLKYWDKVESVLRNLRGFRNRALTLPKDHLAYGMLAATENGDLCATSVECGTTYGDTGEKHSYDGVVTGDKAMDCHTSVPMYDISFGTVRGFQAMGPLLQQLGKKHSRPDISVEGTKLVQDAKDLHADINTSLQRSIVHNVDEHGKVGQGNLSCYPSWPGAGQCGGGNICTSGTYKFPSRDMCGGGTGPGAPMPTVWQYSGAFNSGNMGRGWLINDNPPHAIAQVFDQSTNQMSRGTWTSVEVPALGLNNGLGTGISTWTGMMYAVKLKQLLLWEHPAENVLWVGRACPRVWLAPGERISMNNATTAYGRISIVIEAAAASAGHYYVSLKPSERFVASPPPGGIALRIRSPLFTEGKRIMAATVGGKPVPASAINATAETVSFATLPVVGDLASITVTVA